MFYFISYFNLFHILFSEKHKQEQLEIQRKFVEDSTKQSKQHLLEIEQTTKELISYSWMNTSKLTDPTHLRKDALLTLIIGCGNRSRVSYIESTLTSIFKALDNEEKQQINMFVYRTTPRDQTNYDPVSKFVPVVHRADLMRNFISRLHWTDIWRQYTETEDWVAALKFCALMPTK
jgi:hypothetical protein